jgi:hypothetical protein
VISGADANLGCSFAAPHFGAISTHADGATPHPVSA